MLLLNLERTITLCPHVTMVGLISMLELPGVINKYAVYFVQVVGLFAEVVTLKD